jgi:hypothetical protein
VQGFILFTTIQNTAELRTLLNTRKPVKVRLAVAGMNQEDAERWGRRLNATVNPCGCKEGAVALVIGLAICTGLYMIDSLPVPPSMPGQIAAVVLTFAAIVGLGKAIGKRLARQKFKRLVAGLLRQLEGR